MCKEIFSLQRDLKSTSEELWRVLWIYQVKTWTSYTDNGQIKKVVMWWWTACRQLLQTSAMIRKETCKCQYSARIRFYCTFMKCCFTCNHDCMHDFHCIHQLNKDYSLPNWTTGQQQSISIPLEPDYNLPHLILKVSDMSRIQTWI
jgi:hypothetical protein